MHPSRHAFRRKWIERHCARRHGAYTAAMKRKIVLASQSPWRKDILSRTGLSFVVQKSAFEEDLSLPMPPKKLAIVMARGKAEDVAQHHRDALVIAADTFAVCGGELLGKPHTAARAKKTLAKLSDRWHEAITGLVIIDTKTGKSLERAVVTKVHFRKLSNRDIDAYVKTGEPLQVAAGYAIQARGGFFIDAIRGDFWNIVGLPLSVLVESLSEFGIRIP